MTQILENLHMAVGLGVAGNFAHHLEQAGEAADFEAVPVDAPDAPKGMFPFFVPNAPGFLSTFPLDNDSIRLPNPDDKLQVEPETLLICYAEYSEEGQVTMLTPTHFCAFNDCSIRKQGAEKISDKKNWGLASKGISSELIPIDRFEPEGIMDHYHIAAFLKRDGTVHAYGMDSPLVSYSYFYGKLITWMKEKLNHQADEGPLENLNTHLKTAGYPETLMIAIGATCYTPFGESTYLQKGDEILVVIYDARKHTEASVLAYANGEETVFKDASILRQRVL